MISGHDRVRASILFDAKADYLLYGMAEKAAVEFAGALRAGSDVRDIRGMCYIAGDNIFAGKRNRYLELPPYETVSGDKLAFIEMFHTFYQNSDPLLAKGLFQKHGTRYLVQNPPGNSLTQPELDAVYALDFRASPASLLSETGSGTGAGDNQIFGLHPSRLLWRV